MNTMTEKSHNECYDIVYAQRLIFRTGKTRSYDFRLKNLKGVRKFLVEREKEIVSAFETDLGKYRKFNWFSNLLIVVML